MELHLATAPEKAERDLVTFAEWGKRLSLEQYLERERALREHPFSRGMRTWFLVDGSAVLASCETFENVSFVGETRGTTWSIASVFTEERHRGRGHATRLMNLVARAGDVQACVLFSDVGERIYARSGYVTVPEQHDWLLAPRAGEVRACEPVIVEPHAVARHELQLFATREQLDWAFERERLYARFLGRTAPAVHAARRAEAHACWAAYFKANELIILWLQPGAEADTNAVLDAARAEAHRCGLERVRLWGLPGVAPPRDAFVRKRKEELAMVRPRSGLRIDGWSQVQRAFWV
ncbi:MAG: N-acetyltransferase [Myxococcaceae bacterium]|nr:N-acetyltransferase [Myxococcaceae bacterium]